MIDGKQKFKSNWIFYGMETKPDYMRDKPKKKKKKEVIIEESKDQLLPQRQPSRISSSQQSQDEDLDFDFPATEKQASKKGTFIDEDLRAKFFKNEEAKSQHDSDEEW